MKQQRSSSPDNILEWTPAQVGAWLANIVHLPHLVPMFVSEAVDGQLLLTLTDADLAGELHMRSKKGGGKEGEEGGEEGESVFFRFFVFVVFVVLLFFCFFCPMYRPID
jgi:hypothetical protein